MIAVLPRRFKRLSVEPAQRLPYGGGVAETAAGGHAVGARLGFFVAAQARGDLVPGIAAQVSGAEVQLLDARGDVAHVIDVEEPLTCPAGRAHVASR